MAPGGRVAGGRIGFDSQCLQYGRNATMPFVEPGSRWPTCISEVVWGLHETACLRLPDR